eukprot:423010-Amphidinium_carterae.2
MAVPSKQLALSLMPVVNIQSAAALRRLRQSGHALDAPGLALVRSWSSPRKLEGWVAAGELENS